jgi:GAF domain-containing protein
MLTGFKKFLRPPVSGEPEKAAQARSIYFILLVTFALTILFIGYAIFFPPPGQLIIAIIAAGIEIGLLVLVQSKHIQLASSLFSFMLWVAIVVEVAIYGGIRDTGFGAFTAIILITGLTMGTRASLIFVVMTLLAGGGLAVAENQGLLPAYTSVPIFSVLISHSITLITVALLLQLAIRNISSIAHKAIENEKIEKDTNNRLQESQSDLKLRTIALEHQNTALQTVTSVSRLTSQLKSEQELLEASVKVLEEQYKLEYVGIFVMEQTEDFAILQVSRAQVPNPLGTGEYKIPVVRSASSGLFMGSETLRFSVGNWVYYVDPPKQLADMKISLIYPLLTSDKLIGLLNIQTTSDDIQDNDNQTFQMLADQIALSMINIRLLNQQEQYIQEVGGTKGSSAQSAWMQLGMGRKLGYTYDRIRVMRVDQTFSPDVTNQLLAGKSVSFISAETPPRTRLAAPIILREAIIGVIGYDSNNIDHEWQDDEKALLETVASRVSLALENTRLVAEAEQRAERERVIGQITTRMRETLDIETILKTAVKEMRQSLELREAEVRMQLAENSKSIGAGNE